MYSTLYESFRPIKLAAAVTREKKSESREIRVKVKSSSVSRNTERNAEDARAYLSLVARSP